MAVDFDIYAAWHESVDAGRESSLERPVRSCRLLITAFAALGRMEAGQSNVGPDRDGEETLTGRSS